jgi:hypothetical protein
MSTKEDEIETPILDRFRNEYEIRVWVAAYEKAKKFHVGSTSNYDVASQADVEVLGFRERFKGYMG